MATAQTLNSDFDGAWKDLLEEHLADFLEKYFPTIHREIDWSQPVEFLDQELRELLPDGGSTERRVDKLIKVLRQDGSEQWLLVHLEIQSFREAGFAERIYHYNHTIHRARDHRVISLVVLADLNKSWHPKSFHHKDLGCEIKFEFPTSKLLDRLPDLVDDFSLPALAAKAQIAALQTSGSAEQRFDARWQLVRSLYDHGFSAEEVRSAYRLLAWMMMLPRELTLTFRQKTIDFEKEMETTYITDTEQLAIEQGIEQGIEQTQEKLILTMYQHDMSIDEIAEVTELPIEKVTQLVSKK